MTKRSPYSEEKARTEICTSERKYLFLYPMVKQRRWYGLPPEERGRIMKSHIEVGRRYPEITINTTYSYGIDDQEFVVCFEGDDPGEFLDLVNELRPTESSEYTERETPIFTCVAMSAAQGARRPRRHRRRGAGRRLGPELGPARPARRIPYSSASNEQDRQPREPASRRHRRRRPVRLLRRRAHPQRRRPARPGRPLRPPPHPVRAGPRRRRPGPPEDQVGDPRLRKNRGPRGLPLLRQRQDRPRHRGRGARAALPRDRLHGRLRDRPRARRPRRGPARQPRRHRLRRLVQRPPRLRRPTTSTSPASGPW